MIRREIVTHDERRATPRRLEQRIDRPAAEPRKHSGVLHVATLGCDRWACEIDPVTLRLPDGWVGGERCPECSQL
jgi:hypothetical protein